MTAKALITKAELLRMAKIAKEYGVVVERVYNGITVRVGPHGEPPIKSSPQSAGRRQAPHTVPSPIQPPLNKYELAVMKSLAALGVTAKVRSAKLKLFGAATREKLLARGYVDLHRAEGSKPRDETVSLTQKGFKDWEAYLKHIRDNPYL
ncbi:UNVERIFIED_ORG: hypothetical protein J2W66_003127 [Agrobacterium larrymoorei]|nr:hypothetical protein [Agrobacterium larrymoorei]